MPLYIVRNDITRMAVDAIVNPTNEKMLPDGGVDAVVHEAAGEALSKECRRLGMLQPGHVVLTDGYALPCRYIIHTVGPRWYDGLWDEEAVLRRCYREALKLAKEKGCESIAFPLVAAGSFGFPAEKAMHIAGTVIQHFLDREDMSVYLVVYDESSYHLGKAQFPDVQTYIDNHYVAEKQKTGARDSGRREFYRPSIQSAAPEPCNAEPDVDLDFAIDPAADYKCAEPMAAAPQSRPDTAKPAAPRRWSVAPGKAESSRNDLMEMLRRMDEGFSETLFRLIDEKGLTDAQCYKKANIDRKLFSKIRNPQYKPSKPTVLALAIALELSLPETSSLLQKAGFALSHSSKFDVIVEYCILNRIYNIFEVNEILFSYDQCLLGSVN